MAGAIVSEHWSTWMTQSVSTLARINSHGYHLLQKQTQQHIRSNKLTSVSGKICSLFQPFWLLATSINLLPAFVSWQIAPLSTSPACSLSIPPQSLPYAHLCPTVIFFTLCILLFSSIYFFWDFSFASLTLSSNSSIYHNYIYQLFPVGWQGSPLSCREPPPTLAGSALAHTVWPGD